jgi:hypothetical protein
MKSWVSAAASSVGTAKIERRKMEKWRTGIGTSLHAMDRLARGWEF